MQHYDEIDLILYKEDLLDQELGERIREHIFSCSSCRETYLSLISQEEITQAQDLVGEDFTANIMEAISSQKIVDLEDKRASQKNFRTSLLSKYVLVSGFALVLTANGIFNNLGSMEALETEKISEINNYTFKMYSISEDLTEKLYNLMNKGD